MDKSKLAELQAAYVTYCELFCSDLFESLATGKIKIKKETFVIFTPSATITLKPFDVIEQGNKLILKFELQHEEEAPLESCAKPNGQLIVSWNNCVYHSVLSNDGFSEGCIFYLPFVFFRKETIKDGQETSINTGEESVQ